MPAVRVKNGLPLDPRLFTNIDSDLTIIKPLFVTLHNSEALPLRLLLTENSDKGETKMNHFSAPVSALQRRFLTDEKGQTMVEYVMLIVLVALAVFLLTPNIKSAILTVFSNTSSALQ